MKGNLTIQPRRTSASALAIVSLLVAHIGLPAYRAEAQSNIRKPDAPVRATPNKAALQPAVRVPAVQVPAPKAKAAVQIKQGVSAPVLIKQPRSRLRGFADLHTHPMSYLGFGRKAVHGAPDVGMIIPAGTHDCNSRPTRARSMADALGSCNSTHGGWGVDNP